jgi:hypothetical protein
MSLHVFMPLTGWETDMIHDCDDIFGVNTKGGQSIDSTFKPPLFSL